jgi:class 3 adenylate cyclase
LQRFVENRIDLSVFLTSRIKTWRSWGVCVRVIPQNAARDPRFQLPQRHPSMSVASEPAWQESAERRPRTIMFCDLVGSTALSARFDPEDLRGIIAAYHRCSPELVERNGGFVAKYMGICLPFLATPQPP